MHGTGRKQVCARPELATVLLGHLQTAGRNGLSGATLQLAEHNYQQVFLPRSLQEAPKFRSIQRVRMT